MLSHISTSQVRRVGQEDTVRSLSPDGPKAAHSAGWGFTFGKEARWDCEAGWHVRGLSMGTLFSPTVICGTRSQGKHRG